MSERPTHLSPKPFLVLEDARIALDALTNALRTARVELARIEERATTLLLSDDDARDVIAEYAVLKLARSTFLEDARIALDALTNALRTARVELARIEERATTLLLSDDDARDVIAEYAVLKLARSTFLEEYPDPMLHEKGHPARDGWSDLCHRTWVNEMKLTALGDNFQRAREAMAARVAEAAKKGVAA